MREELDNLLCTKFPNLYKDRRANVMATCMCWGFECNDGWFQLIYDLSEKLEAEILKLPEDTRPHCCASQVKEKYGTLRFYMTAASDAMYDLIDEAERKSGTICEVCGAPGVVRGLGWLFTACEEHSEGMSPTNEFDDEEEEE